MKLKYDYVIQDNSISFGSIEKIEGLIHLVERDIQYPNIERNRIILHPKKEYNINITNDRLRVYEVGDEQQKISQKTIKHMHTA